MCCRYGKNRTVSSNFKGVNVNIITCSHAMCARVIWKPFACQLEACMKKLHGRHHHYHLRVKHIFKQRKIADQKICMRNVARYTMRCRKAIKMTATNWAQDLFVATAMHTWMQIDLHLCIPFSLSFYLICIVRRCCQNIKCHLATATINPIDASVVMSFRVDPDCRCVYNLIRFTVCSKIMCQI